MTDIGLDVSVDRALPSDASDATLVGRVWRPDVVGRSVVGVRGDELVDILGNAPRSARDPARPWLVSPIDLQAVKAAGALMRDLATRGLI